MLDMRAPVPVASSLRGLLVLPLLAAAAALGAAGCGAGAVEAKSVSPKDTPLTDADSAIAELGRAEGEIRSLFGPDAEAATVTTGTPGEPSAAPPPPDQPVAQAAAPTAGRAEQVSTDAAGDPCSIACRALASMDRAATHLCGLSGESDPACTSARERVKNASDRVSARCACSR